MQQLIQPVINWLQAFAHQVPLTVFAFVGSLVDEIVAIVPSPLVPITSGTLAFTQNKAFWFLFVIAFFGTLGKTLATLLTYWIADKLEDFLTGSKIGKILGIDKHEIEQMGKFFNGTRKDELVMIILRALPFVPTLPVSVIAGLVKLNIVSFMVTTFIGTYIRFMFYLILAYQGVKKYEGMLNTVDATNSIFEILIVMSACGWAFLFLRKNWERIYKKAKSVFKK